MIPANSANIQYSLRRARPLKTAYFLRTSLNQLMVVSPHRSPLGTVPNGSGQAQKIWRMSGTRQFDGCKQFIKAKARRSPTNPPHPVAHYGHNTRRSPSEVGAVIRTLAGTSPARIRTELEPLP